MDVKKNSEDTLKVCTFTHCAKFESYAVVNYVLSYISQTEQRITELLVYCITTSSVDPKYASREVEETAETQETL